MNAKSYDTKHFHVTTAETQHPRGSDSYHYKLRFKIYQPRHLFSGFVPSASHVTNTPPPPTMVICLMCANLYSGLGGKRGARAISIMGTLAHARTHQPTYATPHSHTRALTQTLARDRHSPSQGHCTNKPARTHTHKHTHTRTHTNTRTHTHTQPHTLAHSHTHTHTHAHAHTHTRTYTHDC